MMTRLAFITCAAAALLCSAGHRPRAAIGVVVITLDTTRADRLSPYGLMDSPMPALERLAREGVVFDQAVSPVPLTLPAHSSIFTGLLPQHHGVADNADAPLAATHRTLADVLHERGFRTAAFVGSSVLERERGLARGFDVYADAMGTGVDGALAPQRRASAVIDEAAKFLDGVGRSSFFLWIHLYDAHRPYDPPEPFRSSSADPYIGEIRYMDSQIGRLLAQLDRQGQSSRTTIVVAGDHGESLGEHGERDHGMQLYDSVLRVPLIVRTPGAKPRRVDDVVRLTDIAPTILDLAGVAAPPSDGLSLMQMIHGGRREVEREAYAESLYPRRFGRDPLRSLRDARFKFIEGPRRELYDLARDPFELRNLVDERPTVAAAMHARLAALTGAAAQSSAAPATELSLEARQRLAALGYADGGSPPPPIKR